MNKSFLFYIHSLSQQLASLYATKEEQQQIAQLLLQKVTGKSLLALVSEQQDILTDEQEKQLLIFITEHVQHHKPLQYILGSVPFGDLDSIVEPPTLIPRSETEEWVMNLVAQLQKLPNKKLTILDMCTGSGVIALSLAKALPQATIYAVDSEVTALKLAQRNADFNDISTVTFIQSDLFSQLPKDISFDLIVTNPPYISQKEYNDLDPMVKEWEDEKALVAQENGLALITSIIKEAPTWLRHNDELREYGLGNLYVEIGHLQGPAVYDLLVDHGYSQITILKDLAGHDRVAVGYYCE